MPNITCPHCGDFFLEYDKFIDHMKEKHPDKMTDEATELKKFAIDYLTAQAQPMVAINVVDIAHKYDLTIEQAVTEFVEAFNILNEFPVTTEEESDTESTAQD